MMTGIFKSDFYPENTAIFFRNSLFKLIINRPQFEIQHVFPPISIGYPKVGGDMSLLKMILRYSYNFICCLDTTGETFQLIMNREAEEA